MGRESSLISKAAGCRSMRTHKACCCCALSRATFPCVLSKRGVTWYQKADIGSRVSRIPIRGFKKDLLAAVIVPQNVDFKWKIPTWHIYHIWNMNLRISENVDCNHFSLQFHLVERFTFFLSSANSLLTFLRRTCKNIWVF